MPTTPYYVNGVYQPGLDPRPATQLSLEEQAMRSGGPITPTSFTGETPAGDLSLSDQGTSAVSGLGNLRIALRSALNEAASKRVANNYQQVAPLAGGVPGTIGSVVDMIRAGIKSPVENTFSDILTTFKDANDAKKKELDRINELRVQFGSAVPSNVTDLSTALDLVAPLVDEENRLKLKKMESDQTTDNDVESWADSFAKGEITIGSVPSAIRTQVKVRADAIKTKLESDAKQEYQDRIVFRIEKKTSDYETERTLVVQDANLSVSEQRDVLEYIDTLEQQQKATKEAGKKPKTSFGSFNTGLNNNFRQ